MNFIVEILPKKEQSSSFVFVVRNGNNGFPLAVCDTLEGAKDVIREKFDKMVSQMAKQSNSNS